MTFERSLQHQASRHADRAAIVMAGSGEVTTYAELDDRSSRLAHVLRNAGLSIGDHIALDDAQQLGLPRGGLGGPTGGAALHRAQQPPAHRRGAVHPRRLRGHGLRRVRRAGRRRGRARPDPGGPADRRRTPRRQRARRVRRLPECARGGAGRTDRRRGRGPRDALLLRHDRPTEGREQAARAGGPGRSGVPRRGHRRGRRPGPGRRRRLPHAGAAVPRRPARLHDGLPPRRGHRGGHGVLRRRSLPRRHRALRGDPRPVRADDVHPPAAAPRGRARRRRHLLVADGAARRRPLPGRGQAGDVRLVGTDPLRVLRRHRGHRGQLHRTRGVARPPRLGGPAQRRAARPRPRRGGARRGRGGHDLVRRRRAGLRVPQRPRQDGRLAQRARLATPSATWATSTPTGTCTSPTGPPT